MENMQLSNIENENDERFNKIRALPKGPEAIKALAFVRRKYFLNQDFLNLLKLVWEQMFQDPKHFLLELIQNADDAQYKKAVSKEIKPTIRFIIKKSSLELRYNEDGFTIDDVIAITGVASTKIKVKEQIKKTDTEKASRSFIGEKGIGFKSVFALASEVEIESPPWNFKLKKDTCIVPEILTSTKLKEPPYGTRIEVHFDDPDTTTDIIGRELFRFVDGQIESFLFLQKLSAFSVEDHREKPTRKHEVVITHPNKSGEFLQLQTSPNRQKRTYFYYSEKVEFEKDLVKERWGKIGSELGELFLEIIVAIPQNDKDYDIENGKLFCFLPTKIQLPVPFFLHVDGMTTADRERLLDPEFNKWNSHLFDELPKVLLNAILEMTKHPEMFESIQNYIPTDSGKDQLKGVFDDLIKKLRNKPWIRVLDRDETEWASPNEVVELDGDFWIPWFEKYPELRKSAEERLGKQFVYPSWTTNNKWQSLKNYYQIPTITQEEEVQIIATCDLPSEFTKDESTFIEFYKHISKIIEIIAKSEPDSLVRIQNILLTAKIYPLEEGTFGALHSEENNEKIYWLSEQTPKKTGLGGVVEFRIINPEYTYKPFIGQDFPEEKKNSLGKIYDRNETVRTLLEDLGIKELNDEQKLIDLQIPWLLNPNRIDSDNYSKLYEVISQMFESYHTKRTSRDNLNYLSQLYTISEALFPSTEGTLRPLKSLLLPDELRIEPLDNLYSESGLETLKFPQKGLKISKKDSATKEDNRESEKIKKLREDWRSFLILCGIKSKPEFVKPPFSAYHPEEFMRVDRKRFVIWEKGINNDYTPNNPVYITIIELDEPTQIIINNQSGNSTQFSDLLFNIWKDNYGELAQQKTREEKDIIPGEFFTEYTRKSPKHKKFPDCLWAGIERERIPLTTIDNKVATSRTARRITDSKSSDLPIIKKYIQLVSEAEHIEDYRGLYYDSLDVKKLSVDDINGLWNSVDEEDFRDIIRVAIECVNAEIIDGESLKLSLELFDKEEERIRPVTDFYLGKQARKGVPSIEKQYGDAGRELGKLLNLLSEDDPIPGVFDTIFERGFGVHTISSDEKLFGLMTSWSKWNETSRQLIKDDFEKSLKKNNFSMKPLIIFNSDFENSLKNIEAIVINFEITMAEIRVFKKVAIDLGLIFPEEFGELKIKADPLEIDEVNETNKICDALLEFYEKDDKEVLSEKLQLIGGYENLGKKIRKNSRIQRVITINEEFVIDVKLPFFDEKDQLFYVGQDLKMKEIISELFAYFGFAARKSQTIKDIDEALSKIRKKPGSDKATEKGKIPPAPEPSPDRKPGDPPKLPIGWPECDAKDIPIRPFEKYSADGKKKRMKIDIDTEPEEENPNGGRSKDNLSKEDKDAIGEQGEKYAVCVLLDMKKEKYPNAKVEEIISQNHYKLLINDKTVSEINRPGHNQPGYDIKVKDGDLTEYFEVKSTIDDSKDKLQITASQWKFAQENGNLFHILRVYNIGSENARIVIITNPCKQLEDGKLEAKFDVRLYI